MAVQSLHVSNVEDGEQECRGKLPVELVEDLVEVEEALGVLEKRLDGTPWYSEATRKCEMSTSAVKVSPVQQTSEVSTGKLVPGSEGIRSKERKCQNVHNQKGIQFHCRY